MSNVDTVARCSSVSQRSFVRSSFVWSFGRRSVAVADGWPLRCVASLRRVCVAVTNERTVECAGRPADTRSAGHVVDAVSCRVVSRRVASGAGGVAFGARVSVRVGLFVGQQERAGENDGGCLPQ